MITLDLDSFDGTLDNIIDDFSNKIKNTYEVDGFTFETRSIWSKWTLCIGHPTTHHLFCNKITNTHLTGSAMFTTSNECTSSGPGVNSPKYHNCGSLEFYLESSKVELTCQYLTLELQRRIAKLRCRK
jgi:hypothetical protein